ncbi:MAG: ATP-binding protein [Planctomycetota bacterium]
MRVRYVLALGLVASLSVIVHLKLHHLICVQASDAPRVNIAGRQRMLSQKIAKAAYAFQDARMLGDVDLLSRSENEARGAIDLWESSHLALQRGNASLGLAPIEDDALLAAYRSLDPVFVLLTSATRDLLDAPPDTPHAEIDALLWDIRNAESVLLPKMHAIVEEHEANSAQRLNATVRAALIFGVLTGLVLLLEAFGVFEPTVRLLRKAFAESERRREDAENAERTKAQFLANMSHEIRTPMTAILGYAEMLTDPHASASERLDAAYVIRRNGDHLLQIINDILDMSKIEAGKLDVSSEPTEAAQVVGEIALLFQAKAEEKGLRLSSRAEGNVPGTIVADPLRLRQVLANLVSNAVKFTESGSVEIVMRASGERLAIDVRDTGPGIPENARDRLFRAFEQQDSSVTRAHGGTGLGLTISASLVRMMGASLSIADNPSGGAVFTLEFEASETISREQAERQMRDGDRTHKDESGSGSLKGRILLAEDGPDNRRLISFILSKAGATATVVENGREAVDEALAQSRGGTPYDLILMDIQMPVLDGLSATRELRASGYQGSIMALTAHAMQSERDACLEAGCDAFASKPIDRSTLIEQCARLMRPPSSGAAA